MSSAPSVRRAENYVRSTKPLMPRALYTNLARSLEVCRNPPETRVRSKPSDVIDASIVKHIEAVPKENTKTATDDRQPSALSVSIVGFRLR
jgi:hypothetical protein